MVSSEQSIRTGCLLPVRMKVRGKSTFVRGLELLQGKRRSGSTTFFLYEVSTSSGVFVLLAD